MSSGQSTSPEATLIHEETALEWMQRLDCDMAFLRIGHDDFDKLKLIKNGDLTEIIGQDATGKMQVLIGWAGLNLRRGKASNSQFKLAMTIIAELLLSEAKQNHMVYVIDFNGSFRMDRLVEIITKRCADIHLSEDCSHPGPSPLPHDLLNRVNYSCAMDLIELDKRLLELESLMKYSSAVPLIFINKIGSILFEAVSTENVEGHIQKRVLSVLKGFCLNLGATIITTNHTVEWRGYPTPSLGKRWIHGISRRIVLCKDQTGFYAQLDLGGQISSEKVRYILSEKGFDVVQANNEPHLPNYL